MSHLNRRTFLKALGLGSGASALSACGLDDNRYVSPIENILPYVVKPEQVTPGTPTFFATSVATGPAAAPVLARHRDGRVINVGSNTRAAEGAPHWAPAVAPTALFEMQRHYSPDRFTAPHARGAALSWEDGLSQLAGAVEAAKAAGKKVAYLGPYRTGAIARLIGDYTDGNAVFWEPQGYDAEASAAEALFGSRALPAYDLSKATYVLSFGAPFLSGWGAGNTPAEFATAKNPNVDHTVARFALVAPHRDQTGVNSDDWFGCKPGGQAAVARAVAHLVAKGHPALRLVGDMTAEKAEKASGLKVEDIKSIAANFKAGKAVALPGGMAGDTDLAAAVYLLNIVGGAGGTLFHNGGYRGVVSSYADVAALIAEMASGAVGVLLLDDVNPVFGLPADSGVAAAIGKVGTVVGLSSHPDESNALAGMVLPVSDVFEDWGDEEPTAGTHLLRQPAMSPLYDTRSLGDILLATARSAGLTVAQPPAPESEEEAPAPTPIGFLPATWAAYLRASWARHVPGFDGSDSAWERAVVDGFHVAKRSRVSPFVSASAYSFSDSAPAGAGEFALHLYLHPFRQDGRYANQPWAQESPDPTTGNVWDSWVEIHPATAAKLGVDYNSKVTIKTDAGSVEIGVQPYKGVREDVVAIALGNGHTAAGRYANNVGVNPVSLMKALTDGGGAIRWGAANATVTKGDGLAGLVTTFSHFGDTDDARNFGVAVNAEALAEKGDAPVEHPGELTGIHHLEMDSRLQERGITDFYTLPDHPTYRFGLSVDTNACTGCGACSVACYAENNLPLVGKAKVAEGREMGWIRVNRYWESVEGHDDVRFVPMMCQQCGHAGCENVCPVLATYHTIDGLNAMIYNRCVGTRYCSNACPFSVRKFNYHSYDWPEPFNLMLNPDVLVRTMGVMEKCTFCVQRIRQVKSAYKDGGNFRATVPDAALAQLPACAEACPSQALTFGNLNDPKSAPSTGRTSARHYEPLADLNVFSAITYLAKANFHKPLPSHGGGHGGDHAAGHDHDAAGADHDHGGHDAAGH